MEIIRAIHPVSWIYKYITDVGFAEPNFTIKREFGAFNELMGVYIVASEEVVAEEKMKNAKERSG